MLTASETERRRIGSRLVFDPGRDCPLLERIFEAPDDAVDRDGTVLKHDRTTTIARIAEADTTWVVKRYNTKNAWHAVRRNLQRSRARNCWEMSRVFQNARIPVPAAIGYIENSLAVLRGRSYFLYEFIDAQNLLSFMKARRGRAEVDTVIGNISGIFQNLHSHAINHGDMKATNILVEPDLGLRLLDLDAARQPHSRAAFERGYARDRQRFLDNWRSDPDLRDRFDSKLPAV